MKPITKEEVNSLIKNSFGMLYNGDWTTNHEMRSGMPDFRTKKLERIAKLSLLSIFPPFPISHDVGIFTDEDGSSLIVKEKYLKEAREYARLYKKETGIKVSITSCQNKAELKDFGYLPLEKCY
ncbi:hypothetical protein CMI39_01525 [Candidatus Pacearchaeota archaeon]|jgi:hypothetical protein|nr:hypothetical protein [Candidatus Pacearchaeota archaeon]|tara:strand:- start:13138 stop:13509 length:372 start_codon:yes stop_codon:yes gene_type:complete